MAVSDYACHRDVVKITRVSTFWRHAGNAILRKRIEPIVAATNAMGDMSDEQKTYCLPFFLFFALGGCRGERVLQVNHTRHVQSDNRIFFSLSFYARLFQQATIIVAVYGYHRLPKAQTILHAFSMTASTNLRVDVPGKRLEVVPSQGCMRYCMMTPECVQPDQVLDARVFLAGVDPAIGRRIAKQVKGRVIVHDASAQYKPTDATRVAATERVLGTLVRWWESAGGRL